MAFTISLDGLKERIRRREGIAHMICAKWGISLDELINPVAFRQDPATHQPTIDFIAECRRQKLIDPKQIKKKKEKATIVKEPKQKKKSTKLEKQHAKELRILEEMRKENLKNLGK